MREREREKERERERERKREREREREREAHHVSPPLHSNIPPSRGDAKTSPIPAHVTMLPIN